MRAGAAISAWALLMLAMASGAEASTVAVEPVAENEELFYEAAAGEENELTASTDGSTVTFEDPGAEITAGTDCQSVSDHVATCDFGPFAPVNADLGNRDDTAQVDGAMIRLFGHGRGGDDRLVGSSLFDILDGGAGPDVLKGRGETDFVRYDGREDDLDITLGDGERNDGGPADGGLRDRLRGIEGVAGGDGSDHITGSAGENNLFGAAGADVLRGLKGPDELIGGGGGDEARGGAGADFFPGGDGADRNFGLKGPDHFQMGTDGPGGTDLFSGGSGHDTVQAPAFGGLRLSFDGNANDGPCANPACTSSDEGDNVVGIEEVDAGFGDDFLIGSRRAEVFNPSMGTDSVRAKGGDDTVNLAIDGDPDDIDCGGGQDEITGTPDATDMNQNCE